MLEAPHLAKVLREANPMTAVIVLANKLPILALHDPDALLAIEKLIDRQLARFGA